MLLVMYMDMYILVFDWCAQEGVKKIFGLINIGLNIIRIVVPIGLIVMLGIDIFKKVLNPEDKDAQKKILHRIIAALVVFASPMLVRFVLKLADLGMGNDSASTTSFSECLR